MNLMLAGDQKMANAWEIFAPEYNVFLMESPGEVSGNLALTKPLVMSASEWMDDPDEQ